MNLPNKLTIVRMVLTPVFLFLFMVPVVPFHYFLGLLVYSAGCITDFLDGKIARKYNLITTFGKLADPVADKMLTTAALLALASAAVSAVPVVVLPQKATLQEKKAAEELALHLKLATGKTVKTVAENAAPTAGKRIFIGNTLFAKKNKADFSKFDQNIFP